MHEARIIRLLVVEDSRVYLHLVQSAFQNRKGQIRWELSVAEDGEQALCLLFKEEQESAPLPDLILLDWNDYVKLHAEMKRQGFSQTIRSDDGKVYELPPAEYDYTGNLNRGDALARATVAAAAVKPSYAVLVSEANART